MKKLIIGILALMLSATSLMSYSQTKDEAGEALNSGIKLKDTDLNAAIAKFEECIKICEQVGVEADDIKDQAEKVLPGLHYKSAIALYKGKKYPEAIKGFEKTIEISEKYNNEKFKEKSNNIIPKLYAVIGNDFFKKKDIENALLNYEKAVELNPNSLKGHFGKALVYRKNGDNDKFKEEIDKIIEIGPETNKVVVKSKKIAVKHFQAQGGKAIMAKKYDEGMKHLETSLLYGEHVKTYYYYAVGYNAQKKWDKATEAATKALELDKEGKMKAKIDIEIENAKKGKETK